jgi:phenylacetate-CoA ligase
MAQTHKIWNLLKLMRSQWWSLEKLQSLQEKKLRRIIDFCYHTIPLYHDKFKAAGIRPGDIRSLHDLKKIPFVTKQEIQENFPKRIVAPRVNMDTCWKVHTSGSTGRPMTVVYDASAEDFEKATALRPNLSCGQKLHDRWAVITYPDRIVEKQWFQKIGILSPSYISLFDEVTTQLSFLERFKPDVLDGYSSNLYLLAQEVQKRGDEVFAPRMIYGTSETLTPQMRATVNAAFKVRMFDQYGGVEMGRTAWECPEHTGYHMDMESVIMEFIREEETVSPGERGEIVYTNLYNYAMPFLRYKCGDIGIPSDEKCSCGRGLPLMKSLEGRKDSFILLPSGRIFPPTTWIIVLMKHPIQQFKVIQHTIDHIEILIVPGNTFSEEECTKIKEETKEVLKEEVEIEITLVKEIPREKSGKLRCFQSKVTIEW